MTLAVPLTFDIQVYDVSAVQVLESLQDLRMIIQSQLFRQTPLHSQQLSQRTWTDGSYWFKYDLTCFQRHPLVEAITSFQVHEENDIGSFSHGPIQLEDMRRLHPAPRFHFLPTKTTKGDLHKRAMHWIR